MKAVILSLLIIGALSTYTTKKSQCRKGGEGSIEFDANVVLDAKPTKGSDDKITVSGVALDHLELSEVKLQCYLNKIPVYSITTKNSEIYDEGDPLTFEYVNNIPTYTPSGHIQVDFHFFQGGEDVGCVGLEFDI